MSDIALTEAVNKDLAEEKVAPVLTFDEKVAKLISFIQFEPLIREVDYKILEYCFERKGLSDIEEHVAGLPEFRAATRDQYSLITELVNHHGLEFFELDEAGNPVLDEDKAGLSENEIDDLVVGYAYRITEVGKEVVAQLDPRKRLNDLFEAEPHRVGTYLAIVEFLREKHSFAEVDSYVRQCDEATVSREAGDGGIQPTVFVDKLERAGGVFYDGGWQATEAGTELLVARKSPVRV